MGWGFCEHKKKKAAWSSCRKASADSITRLAPRQPVLFPSFFSFFFFFSPFYLFFSFLSPFSPFYLFFLLSISFLSLLSPFQKNSNSFSTEKSSYVLVGHLHINQVSEPFVNTKTYKLTTASPGSPCTLYFIINTNTHTLPTHPSTQVA